MQACVVYRRGTPHSCAARCLHVVGFAANEPMCRSQWRAKLSGRVLGARRSPREGFSQEGCAHANWGGARRTRKLDGLRCRRGGRQGVFEGQTSDGDEPGDPSPLPRLPHSGRNRAAPGGLITSDRNLVRARRDYRLFERSLDGHACSYGCAISGVAGVQRRGRQAPQSSFGRSAKAAPHTAVGRTEDSARGAHRDPRLTGGSHAESRCPLGRTRRRDIHY